MREADLQGQKMSENMADYTNKIEHYMPRYKRDRCSKSTVYVERNHEWIEQDEPRYDPSSTPMYMLNTWGRYIIYVHWNYYCTHCGAKKKWPSE